MATEITGAQTTKLVNALKKHPDESETFYAEASGIPRGAIGPAIWANEPVADPKLKFSGTPAQIADARDKQGLRWERIAARTGLSVAECKRRYEEKTGKSYKDSYTGRGRPAGGDGSKSTGTSGRRQSGKKNTGTSGRRAAKSTGKQAGRRQPGRARTRAERAAKAGNPS